MTVAVVCLMCFPRIHLLTADPVTAPANQVFNCNQIRKEILLRAGCPPICRGVHLRNGLDRQALLISHPGRIGYPECGTKKA